MPSESNNDNAKKNSTKFTLVHGTFAANASWVRNDERQHPDSFRGRLHKALAKAASFSVAPPWGSASFFGRLWDLSNAARLNGAERLKQHILSQERDESERHFLVAHSHGGNVAMYALQDPQVQQRIAGLICMATPFLYPRLRPLNILTLVVSLLIMVVGILQFVGKMHLLDQGPLAWGSAVTLIITGIAIPTFVVCLIVRERYKRKVTGDPKLQEHVSRLSFTDPNIPILLIRASGDEASGLLRGTQFLNWLGGLAIRLGGKQMYVLIYAAALVLLWMAYEQVAWLPDGSFTFISNALIFSSAVIMIMLMALTLSRISIGLDAWPWVGELETMVEDGPPGIASELIVITPRQPEGGLSHTEVYSQAETIEAIADWCKSV